MARKPQVRYFPSRGAYYCQWQGRQHKLAEGPDDAPTGPTYLAALAAFKYLLAQGQVHSAGDSNTVRTLFEAYLAAKDGHCRSGTFRNKCDFLQLFTDRFGDLPAEQIRSFHAQQIVQDMQKPRLKQFMNQDGTPGGTRLLQWGPVACRNFLSQLKAAFSWCFRQELISRHPLRAVDMPADFSRSRDRIITPAEHAQVLAALEEPRTHALRRLVIGLENTGCRPSELTQALVGNFDREQGAILYYADSTRRAEEHAHKTSGKGKNRVIYFTGEALEMVRELANRKKAADPLFPNSLGKKYRKQSLSELFSTIRQRTGLAYLIPYTYRHTFATRWLVAGKSIEILATLLGNTPATILRHYSHLIHEHTLLRRELEAFQKAQDR